MFDTQNPDDIRKLVSSEREKCLSVRELSHRMMGFGYKVETTDAGIEVKSMMGGETLVTL